MDGDLNSLLDDALADFDKPVSDKTKKTSSTEKNKPNADEKRDPPLAPPTDMFNEFFGGDMTEKLQEEWNLAMKELQEENPELAKHMSMLSEASSSAASNVTVPNTSSVNNDDSNKSSFDVKMKEALESMSKSANQDKGNDDLMNSFLNMGLEGDGPIPEGDLPGFEMMEDLMKTMLSKEMLYPPMKEMCKNYPLWLENNKNSISKSEKEKYEKQLFCLQKVCNEFEKESESDTDEVRQQRFVCIMDTVNEMQQYGQPPESLVGNETPIPPDNCVIS